MSSPSSSLWASSNGGRSAGAARCSRRSSGTRAGSSIASTAARRSRARSRPRSRLRRRSSSPPCGYWALDQISPLLGLAWNVLILYLLVGFRHFSHAFSAIVDALKAGDAIAARRRLAAWRGSDASAVSAEEIPKLAIEQGLEDSYRHVFGILFWFLVLPGPAGAVLYRATVLARVGVARRRIDAARAIN